MSRVNLLMIDPEITEPDRSRLRAAARAGLLVPFRGPRPERPAWPADLRREWPSDAAVAAATSGAFAALVGAVALAEWGLSAWHPGGVIPDAVWRHAASLGRVLLYPTLCLAAIVAVIALRCAAGAARDGWRRPASIPDYHRWHLADAARRHHRRYAAADDLDVAAAALWCRAQIAARAIRESGVIRDQLVVDAAGVLAALPYRLWEIAGKLARLSELRERQRAILGGVSERDPDISRVLRPQLSANERAEADAAGCVGRLEELAGRLAAADAERRRARAARELRTLTSGYHELLAGLGRARLPDDDITGDGVTGGGVAEGGVT